MTTSLLRQHKKKVHDLCSRNCPKSCKDTVKSLKCDLCPFAATHMDALYHHKNLAHRNKEGTEGTLQTFSCDKCPHQALSQGDNSLDILDFGQFFGPFFLAFFDLATSAFKQFIPFLGGFLGNF